MARKISLDDIMEYFSEHLYNIVVAAIVDTVADESEAPQKAPKASKQKAPKQKAAKAAKGECDRFHAGQRGRPHPDALCVVCGVACHAHRKPSEKAPKAKPEKAPKAKAKPEKAPKAKPKRKAKAAQESAQESAPSAPEQPAVTTLAILPPLPVG